MKYSVLSSVLPELTAEEVAKAIARAGYDGVEWRVNGEYHFPEATIEKEAPRIKALCDAHGSRLQASRHTSRQMIVTQSSASRPPHR